jgi:hypothetical protein
MSDLFDVSNRHCRASGIALSLLRLASAEGLDSMCRGVRKPPNRSGPKRPLTKAAVNQPRALTSSWFRRKPMLTFGSQAAARTPDRPIFAPLLGAGGVFAVLALVTWFAWNKRFDVPPLCVRQFSPNQDRPPQLRS